MTDTHPASRDAAVVIARILLGTLFVLAGINKLMGAEGTIGYIESAGLPLAQVVYAGTVAVEILGGLAIIVGFKARWAGLALALFCIATAALFHNDFSVQSEMTAFLKNLAIGGGMLMVFAFGPGRYSLDKG
ncbi:DoxX family protein [Pontixanthobacter aestiaquae]|uniref:DoxX family membrane protein n=1 Tax=Pontixanthobacter aestiaquae TaxID=1509367 RepID=A0A844ZAF8_9SPHN|nr:DoxX family protein [Pontixanthobacter aestiaquae]MDN3644982.1 DoxX family protein [Pontixanthobacter aestiaquae]MXO84017.1 DoxX family membrane protein [Pontixanthobacter aestiaquae]